MGTIISGLGELVKIQRYELMTAGIYNEYINEQSTAWNMNAGCFFFCTV